MSAEHPEGVARKACTRCSVQKRRCDKALPECTLCARLHQICKYENPPFSSPTPSRPSKPDFFLGFGAFTTSQVKNAVIQKIGSLQPESAILRYSRVIDPSFPILSIPMLESRLPHTWDEASLDFSLLCLSIILLTTTPPSSPEDDSNPSEFKSLYFCFKSLISLVEGLGINSLEILQARTLVTLFEVAHGFYPAAHISIGSIVRAADALVVHPSEENPLSHHSSDETKREDGILTWCGITSLDRYIAMEAGCYAPLTRSYNHPTYTPLVPYLYPSHTIGQDRAAPLYRLSRLFEAFSLLDKLQTTINEPTAEHLFNMEEVMQIVTTLNSLKTILIGETLEGEMYSGELAICDISLLFAFENGSRVNSIDSINSDCLSLAMKSLNFLISSITSKVETFALSAQPVEFDLLPPSIMFLVYKAAALLTQRFCLDSGFNEGVRRLRILRGFLKAVGTRWLCCERYLQLLNEDTTPRILRALEQE